MWSKYWNLDMDFNNPNMGTVAKIIFFLEAIEDCQTISIYFGKDLFIKRWFWIAQSSSSSESCCVLRSLCIKSGPQQN